MFAVGIPSAIATLLFDLDYVVIDRLMVSYHDLALAAIGIVLKVERLPLNVGIGICQGMLPLVAYKNTFAAGGDWMFADENALRERNFKQITRNLRKSINDVLELRAAR